MALVDQSSMETTVAVGKDCRGVELVAVEQAKQLPALEPYVRGFVAGKVRGKGAVQLGCWHGGTVLVFGE